MAAMTCPYCGHAIVSDAEAPAAERCPKCSGELLIAYRYQLVRARGEVAGGELYEAVDVGFAQPMAVLFTAKNGKREATERFVAGHRLFANLRTRGLVGIHEVSRANHPRAHVVMDWLAGGTLDRNVGKTGPLDPAFVWAMTGDLLIGLERAHRALPALVHGQVHPGKIGFRRSIAEGGPAVLFGFEWARQVSEQDSALADSFNLGSDEVHERASSLDLRAFARTIVYAATGKWIEDGTVERQRQQAAALMPGPLAPFIDRLVAAGTPEGYMSTSVARDEFELIRGGGGRPRGNLRPPAPTKPSKGQRDAIEDFSDLVDDDDTDLRKQMAARRSASASSGPAKPFQAAQQAQQRTRAAATPPGKSKFGLLLALGMFGTCVVGTIVANTEDTDRAPPPPPPRAEAVPVWTPPAVEPIPMEMTEPEPDPTPEVATPSFAARKWKPKVDTANAPLNRRSSCELWVGPNPDEVYNCKWALDCKEGPHWIRYFGNGTSGLGRCEIVEGQVVYVEDLEDDDGDGLFVFESRAERPWVLFGDRFASPNRALLLRFEGEGELADQPSEADPREIARRESIPDAELKAGALAIETLATKVGLELDMLGLGDAVVGDAVDDDLPETLDIFALQSTIDAMQPELSACAAPEGTNVEVALTLQGSTGRPSKIELTDTADEAQAACLRTAIEGAEFGRFTSEAMNVNWSIAW